MKYSIIIPLALLLSACGGGSSSDATTTSQANEQAESKNVKCSFIVGNLTDSKFEAESKYEFGYDWEVLHHIFPENRATYIQNVVKMLQKGATYFSVCFSETDPDFGGKGKYRRTPMDTILYFSSENELEQLLKKTEPQT